jgi:hypothetical protein
MGLHNSSIAYYSGIPLEGEAHSSSATATARIRSRRGSVCWQAASAARLARRRAAHCRRVEAARRLSKRAFGPDREHSIPWRDGTAHRRKAR